MPILIKGSGGIVPSGTKNITANGTGIDVADYASVNVNVPVPTGYIKPSGTKSITSNGTHDVKDYASVNVNVSATGSAERHKLTSPLWRVDSKTIAIPVPFNPSGALVSGWVRFEDAFGETYYVMFDNVEIGSELLIFNVWFFRASDGAETLESQDCLRVVEGSSNTLGFYMSGNVNFGQITKSEGVVFKLS